MRQYLILPIAILMLLVSSAPAIAQRTISGVVKDQQNIGISYATILAKKVADSTLLRAETTDTTGRYSLTLTTQEPVFLEVLAVGYEPQQARINAATGGDTVIDFVLVPEVNYLTGATVTAQKPLVERRIDRTIFNVSASISAAGGNAYDAMKKAPGVIVKESDNTVTIAGKTSAEVMINGRRLQLSGEDLTAYLQAIQSDNIDRIEVISTPPAQYDAAGNSGIINIVLKKNGAVGFNGSARVGYEQSTYATGISGAALNYRSSKLNLYANAGYTSGAKHNVERISTPYPDQIFRLEDPYKKQTTNLQYTAGLDYNVGKTGVFGVQLNSTVFRRTDAGNDDIFAESRATGATDSVIHTVVNAAADRRTTILNLNYVWTIDTTGKKLTLNANRLWFDGTRGRDYATDSYHGLYQSPTGFSTRNKNLGRQDVGITTVQADVELPYPRVNIAAGGKVSLVRNDNDYDFLYFDQGVYVNDPGISNAFDYREAVEALYVSAQKDVGKWGFQAGLRAEATQTRGHSRTLNQTNVRRYLSLFPTAYLAWTPSDAHALNLNYSKRINRPGYADLNPFRLYASPYFYTEGNPFLKPSYSHTLELAYTLRQRYSFSAFYQKEVAHFGLVFYTDSNNKTVSGNNANMGVATSWGGSFSGSFTPVKWWEAQAFVTGGVQQLYSTLAGSQGRTIGLPSVYASLNNSFTLNKPKTFLAELNAWALSRNQQDLFYNNGMGSVDTGFRALLLDKKLAVSLNATDLFRTQRSRGVNQTTGQALNSYFDQQSFRMLVSYRFGGDQVKGKRERSTGIEDEQGRM